MASKLLSSSSLSCCCLTIALMTLVTVNAKPPAPTTADDSMDVYIVYVALPRKMISLESYYLDILKKVVHGSSASDRLVYSYKIINGFAARLTVAEKDKLVEIEGVLSAVPSKKFQIDRIQDSPTRDDDTV